VLAEFPERFRFECYDSGTAAEGYKAGSAGWEVFAESRSPRDAGRDTSCTVDSTGNILACKIQWLNATTPTDFTLTYTPDSTPPKATATLVTADGTSHAESCYVE